MAGENTRIHGPVDQAPETTNKVAHCKVCHTQWQVQADSDTEGCKFCDAPASAIRIRYEGPKRGGGRVIQGDVW